MTRARANQLLIVSGLASIVAFFLPFLDVGGMFQASGWTIMWHDHMAWTTRLALLALPVGGAALIYAGATQSARSRLFGFLFGAAVYGYMIYILGRMFFATTGVGLWITLVAAGVAIYGALGALPNDWLSTGEARPRPRPQSARQAASPRSGAGWTVGGDLGRRRTGARSPELRRATRGRARLS